MSASIGSLQKIGMAREITVGTSPAQPTISLKTESYSSDSMWDNIERNQLTQRLEDNTGIDRVMNWTEISVENRVTDYSVGLFLGLFFGSENLVNVGGGVYRHEFSFISYSTFMSSFSFYETNADTGDNFVYPNCVLTNLDIKYDLSKYLMLSSKVLGLPRVVSNSTFTYPLITENEFLQQNVNLYLDDTLTSFGLYRYTIDLALVISSINSITFTPTGGAGLVIASFTVAVTSGLSGKALASNIIQNWNIANTSVSASGSILTIKLLNVAAQWTTAPTAMTISGTTGTPSGFLATIGPVAIKVKSLSISLDRNIDVKTDEVLGLSYPRSYLSKRIKCDFTLEAIYRYREEFYSASEANTKYAMKIIATSNNIGASGIPTNVTFNFPAVYFDKITTSKPVEDFIYQTINGRASLSYTDNAMVTASVTNSTATTY